MNFQTGQTVASIPVSRRTCAVCGMLCDVLLLLLIAAANDVVARFQSPISMLATPASNGAAGLVCRRAAALVG